MGIQQKLHTKLVQKLILTPSLQQAIKLLPMSTLELSDLLNQEMVENPMLEEVSTEEQAAETPSTDAEPEPAKPERAKRGDDNRRQSGKLTVTRALADDDSARARSLQQQRQLHSLHHQPKRQCLL